MTSRPLTSALFLLLVIISCFQNSRAETELSIESLKAGIVKITSVVEGKRRVGTGTIVKMNMDAAYILTASHVIEGDPSPNIYFYPTPDREYTGIVKGIQGGNPKGLAVLRVGGNLPKGLKVLGISANDEFEGGERVTIIGFRRTPLVQWGVFQGIITAQIGIDIIVSGSAVNEGTSGGPILLQDRVIGVLTEIGGHRGEIGYGVPSSITRVALKGWGIKSKEVMKVQPVERKEDTESMTKEIERLRLEAIQRQEEAQKNLAEERARLKAEREKLNLDRQRLAEEQASQEAERRKTEPTTPIIEEARVRSSDPEKRLLREIIGKDGRPMVFVQTFYLDKQDARDAMYPWVRKGFPREGRNQYITDQELGDWLHFTATGGAGGIFWHMAKSYCGAIGKRLPTRQELSVASSMGLIQDPNSLHSVEDGLGPRKHRSVRCAQD